MIREYTEKDKNTIIDFLSECIRSQGKIGYFHPGDFIWRSYFANPGFTPEDNIALYIDDAGALSGFAWYCNDEYAEIFVHPSKIGGTVDEQLYRWIKARLYKNKADGEAMEFVMGGIEHNAVREQLLSRHGFEKINEPGENDLQFHISLDQPFLEEIFADEFELIDMAPAYYAKVLEDRKNKFVVKDYELLTSQPVYNRQLDLAYISGDGDVAAYAICWFDEKSKTAVLEPLFTNEKYRRKNLAFSIIMSEIVRLKKLGATDLYVATSESNTPAINLYKKIGFKIIGRDMGWVKVYESE